jgi:hypothetical protein
VGAKNQRAADQTQHQVHFRHGAKAFEQQMERGDMKLEVFVCFLLIATCSPPILRLDEFWYAAASYRPVYRVAKSAYGSTKGQDLPEFMVEVDLLVRLGSLRTWIDPGGRFISEAAAHCCAAARLFCFSIQLSAYLDIRSARIHQCGLCRAFEGQFYRESALIHLKMQT